METAPTPQSVPPKPEVAMSETDIQAFMAEHRVPRRDQLTMGPDNQWRINGDTVEEWDRVNRLYDKPDHSYSN